MEVHCGVARGKLRLRGCSLLLSQQLHESTCFRAAAGILTAIAAGGCEAAVRGAAARIAAVITAAG